MLSNESMVAIVERLRGKLGRMTCAAVAACSLVIGCETLEKNKGKEDVSMGFLRKKEIPCQIISTWKPEVLFVADPANQGKNSPGLAGRLYLFGKEVGMPMTCEGSLQVDLYDLGAVSNAPPVHLERWNFDSANLQRLVRKDPIGEGYTLFLPWGTYRPDVQRVQLKMQFDQGKGYPLYADTGPMTISDPLRLTQHSSSIIPQNMGEGVNNPGANSGRYQPSQSGIEMNNRPLRQVIPRSGHPFSDDTQQLPPPRMQPAQPLSGLNGNQSQLVPGGTSQMPNDGLRRLGTPGALVTPIEPGSLAPSRLDPPQVRNNTSGSIPQGIKLDFQESRGEDSLQVKRDSNQPPTGDVKVWNLR